MVSDIVGLAHNAEIKILLEIATFQSTHFTTLSLMSFLVLSAVSFNYFLFIQKNPYEIEVLTGEKWLSASSYTLKN